VDRAARLLGTLFLVWVRGLPWRDVYKNHIRYYSRKKLHDKIISRARASAFNFSFLHATKCVRVLLPSLYEFMASHAITRKEADRNGE
jgi:hypothetical protein